MALDKVLLDFRGDGQFMANVLAWRTLPAKARGHAAIPPALHPALHKALAHAGHSPTLHPPKSGNRGGTGGASRSGGDAHSQRQNPLL